MKSKMSMGDRVDAEVIRGGSVDFGMKMKGMYHVECHSPIMVSDPGKFMSHLRGHNLGFKLEPGRLFPNSHNRDQGILHVSHWTPFQKMLSQTQPKLLSKLEGLFSGGQKAWEDINKNTVVNTGLSDVLDKYFSGSSYTAAHYVGLTDSAPSEAAGDTMSSHAGWVEVHTQYSESNRPAWTPGSESGQSIDNSASKATFTITGSTTVGGAFVTTDNTKNGTSGILISVEAFTAGDKAVSNGDTLNVTITFSNADS